MTEFKLTTDHIKTVLLNHGVEADGPSFAKIDAAVDRKKAEHAAMGAEMEYDEDDYLANQTEAATRDVTVQLVKKELLPLDVVLMLADTAMRELLDSAGVELPAKRTPGPR